MCGGSSNCAYDGGRESRYGNASDFIVSFSPSLARKLGYLPLSTYGVGEHIASRETDLTVKMLRRYSYTVLQRARARRCGRRDGTVASHRGHETYGRAPLYIPLQKKNFHIIEINIMTDTGNPVPFVRGKSVAVLEFKRIGLLPKVRPI